MTGDTPEAEYEPGEIYEDARGFRYLRVQADSLPRLPASGTPLPWVFLDRSGDAIGRLEGIPQRPLRKMAAEAAVAPAAGSVPDDARRPLARHHGQPRARAGASEGEGSDGSEEGSGAKPEQALPVAAAFDREAVREIARMAIGRYWNHDPLGCDDHPAAERVTEAIWPLLEHAQAALTRESLFAAGQTDRAEAAERKLTAITDACRSIPSPIAKRLLAIIGSEEGTDRDV